MGFNDFWINNNGKKEQLNDTKHGVRKEQVDKKFHNLFDAYDVNGDGTLETEELEGVFTGLNRFAGADKTLDAVENQEIASLLANKANIKDADFMGFVRSISQASKDIVSSETTSTPDGGKEVKTTYKDGTVETISYYPDGEYKFKKLDQEGSTTTNYYTIGDNLDKHYTAAEIENRVKKAYNKRVAQIKQDAEKNKPIEGKAIAIIPNYEDFKRSYLKHFNINKGSSTNHFERHDFELSERGKSDVAVRDFVLNHYIESHKAAHDALDTMGILDDIGAAINAGAGEVWNSIKNVWNGTDEEYQNFYELCQKFEPNYEKSLLLKGTQEVAQKHPENYFRGEVGKINTDNGAKFQQVTEQYQNAQILQQRLDILNKAMREISMYQSEQDALTYAPAQSEGMNPASHILKANNLLLEYFNGDKEAVNMILNGTIGNSEATIKAINGLKEDTEKLNKAVLDGKTFDQIQDDYKSQYKAIYGTDFVPDELTEKVMDAKATGGMVKLAAITAISVLITKSPIMTQMMGAAAGSVEATGAAANMIRTLTARYGATAVQQGIKFAMTSGTLATDVGLTLLNQATSERGVDGQELWESTKGSAKYIYFGSYIGAPLAQAVSRQLGKIGATARMFEGGVKTATGGIQTTTITGDKLVQNLMKGGNKVLTTGGAFLTDVAAFTGLEVVTEGQDLLTVGKEQTEMLGKLKIMNHFIEYMLGGRVHAGMSKAKMDAAIENSGIKNWQIKEIKTPNKSLYEVQLEEGLPPVRFKDANELATAMMERVAGNYKGDVPLSAPEQAETKNKDNSQNNGVNELNEGVNEGVGREVSKPIVGDVAGRESSQPVSEAKIEVKTNLATETDLASVHRMDLENFEGRGYDISSNFADYKADLDNHGIETHVLKNQNGKVIGYYQLEPANGKELYIYSIGVPKELQNTRSSYSALKTMQQEIAALAKEKGFETVALDVEPNNPSLVKLYKKFGFEEKGQNPDGDIHMEADVKKVLGIKEPTQEIKTETKPAVETPKTEPEKTENKTQEVKTKPQSAPKTTSVLKPESTTKTETQTSEKVKNTPPIFEAKELSEAEIEDLRADLIGRIKGEVFLKRYSSYALQYLDYLSKRNPMLLERWYSQDPLLMQLKTINTNESVEASIAYFEYAVTKMPEILEDGDVTGSMHLYQFHCNSKEEAQLYMKQLDRVIELNKQYPEIFNGNDVSMRNFAHSTTELFNARVEALQTAIKNHPELMTDNGYKNLKGQLCTTGTLKNLNKILKIMDIIDSNPEARKCLEDAFKNDKMFTCYTLLSGCTGKLKGELGIKVLEKIFKEPKLYENEEFLKNIFKMMPNESKWEVMPTSDEQKLKVIDEILQDEVMANDENVIIQIPYILNCNDIISPERRNCSLRELTSYISDVLSKKRKMHQFGHMDLTNDNMLDRLYPYSSGIESFMNKGLTDVLVHATGMKWDSYVSFLHNASLTDIVVGTYNRWDKTLEKLNLLNHPEQKVEKINLLGNINGLLSQRPDILDTILDNIKSTDVTQEQITKINKIFTSDKNYNEQIEDFIEEFNVPAKNQPKIRKLLEDLQINNKIVELPSEKEQTDGLMKKLKSIEENEKIPQEKKGRLIENLTKQIEDIQNNPEENTGVRVNDTAIKALKPQIEAHINLPNNTKEFTLMLNKIFYDTAKIETTPELFEKLQYDSKYFHLMFSAIDNSEFKPQFDKLIEIIKNNPDKSFIEAIKELPTNMQTKELFDTLGIDYEKWISFDENSKLEFTYHIDVESAVKAAAKNLMEEMDSDAAKKLDSNEINKLKEILKERDIENAGQTRLPKIMKAIMQEIKTNSYWKQKNSKIKEFIEHLEIHKDNIKEVSEMEETSGELYVRLWDKNNVGRNIFFGNHVGCCTSVQNENAFAAPQHLMNTFVNGIEIVDKGGNSYGNSMCYFAKVDGKLTFVIDSFEANGKLGAAPEVTNAIIDYAKQVCKEMGVPDANIMFGPNYNKVDFSRCVKTEGHTIEVIGRAPERTYIDAVGGRNTINEPYQNGAMNEIIDL